MMGCLFYPIATRLKHGFLRGILEAGPFTKDDLDSRIDHVRLAGEKDQFDRVRKDETICRIFCTRQSLL